MPRVAESNHFDFFGLPVSYEIDIALLTARYRELARATHPDRYAKGSDTERRLAMQMTTRLNEAFGVLKNPVARASYLLQLKGAPAADSAGAPIDPAFLAEQIELRERLEAVRGDGAGLRALTADVRRGFDQLQQRLCASLSATSWQPHEARRLVQEMQFLDKLRQQIADAEDEAS